MHVAPRTRRSYHPWTPVDERPPDLDAPPGAVPGSPADAPALAAGPTPVPAPLPPVRKSGLAFFALVLALFAAPGALAQAGNALLGLTWSEVFGLALPAAVVAAGSNVDVRGALLLRRRPPARLLLLAVAIGVLGFFTAGALMALTSLALPARWLELFDVGQLFERSPRERLALSLAAATVAPLCEELAFRGWLLSALRSRYTARAALLASGFLFALMHLDPVRFAALVALGVLYAWLAWRSGSIWPSALAHAVNNGLGLALAAAGVAETSLLEARARPLQVASSSLFVIAFAGGVLALLVAAFRGATTSPPPIDEILVRRDAAQPSTAFHLPRIGRGLALAIAAGVLTWLPLAVAGLRALPRRR
jgi:membrane protease YdiL (CAAX protease family)